jgi:predicted house-cleaning noncanonical NTP pyrophosphatase (MazG superfamily)
MNDDPIAKTLNLTPITELVPNKQEAAETQVHDDFEYARGNLIAVIEKGQEALSGILDVAGMSQHPRSYEVVATLVKAVSDANKDLLELQKRKKDLTGIDPTPTTVNNNLFVGSTAELQQLIKKQNEQSK